MAAGADDVRDAVARAEAVTAVRGARAQPISAVSAAFKRMRNILAQAREKGFGVPERVDESLLLEPAETALAERAVDVAQEVEALRRSARVHGGAPGNSEPAAADRRVLRRGDGDGAGGELRANRLALLHSIARDFSRIADFSEIVTAG